MIKNKVVLAILFVTVASHAVAQDTLTFQTDYYARKTADFSKEQSANIIGVIKEGSHGKVIRWERTKDGQYAGLVEVTDGGLKGKETWIFYDPNASFSTLKIERSAKTEMQVFNACEACRSVSKPESTAKDILKAVSRADAAGTSSEYRGGVAPLWENKNKAAHSWTLHAFKTIDQYGDELLKGTQDIESFCPAYHSLSRDHKIGFWTYFVSALSQHESDMIPTKRMRESTFKNIDAVTKRPVWSEGLLQLSYQDRDSYKSQGLCDGFDWAKDKNLGAEDPRKTILNPEINLSCGIRVLNLKVKQSKMIETNKTDWAVLMPRSHKANRVKEIKTSTNKIPFCKRS